ncbi:Sushi, von Willebrand factor type A, EGF and pentraxin domain-containing protein 1, partial [Geodia barretti]
MRLIVLLVTCLLGSGSCVVDCDYPTENIIRDVISQVFVTGEGAVTPTITLDRHRIVCLAYSRQRDRYRAFSVIVEYTCEVNAGCPEGMVVEQFEAECNGNTWGTRVLGVAVIPRTSPATGDFSNDLREDCSFCASQQTASAAGGAPDPASDGSHCIECNALCSGEEAGARRCFGFGSDSCCQVYLPNGTCGKACPEDGVYSISSDFNCLRDCPDSLGTVGNGRVEYSQNATGEGYLPGTTATVACNDTYETDGYGAICSNAGTWNSTLPNCIVIECGEVPTLVNGKVSGVPATTEVEAVATYECDTDYIFKDERNTRTCQNDKTWSNEDLECVKDVDCGSLTDPVNGTISLTGTAFNSTATYSCNDGYSLVGDTTITCLASGLWSGEPPLCCTTNCIDCDVDGCKVCGADYKLENGVCKCVVTGCSSCESDSSKCDTCEEGRRLDDDKSACSECAVTGCSNCDSDVRKCDTCGEERTTEQQRSKSAVSQRNDG